MKAKYLQCVFIAVFLTEVLLCVVPFTHAYVHREYYITYSVIISLDKVGGSIWYSHYEGLNNRLTWRKPPNEIFSPDSLLKISELRDTSLIFIDTIKYPDLTLAHKIYLPATVVNEDPMVLLHIIEYSSNYPSENEDYLVLAKTGNNILTMVAHVNYGEETRNVVFDSPDYSLSDPNCILSDVILHHGVYVEPDWLITLKVASWILYPVMLVPSAILTWLALGRGRRELSFVLIMVLFTMSFAYVYSVITGNPKGLVDYLTYSSHGLRVVNKSTITVLGIRKVIEVNASKGKETVKLSDLISPYEVKALNIVMDYLNTHKLAVAISQDPSVEISVTGAKKISNNVYAINLPYRSVGPEELSNVELMVKPVTGSKAGAAEIDIYVGFPIDVRTCLEG